MFEVFYFDRDLKKHFFYHVSGVFHLDEAVDVFRFEHPESEDRYVILGVISCEASVVGLINAILDCDQTEY